MIAFRIVSARAEPHSASPAVTFTLRIDEPSGGRIHAIALQAQINVEPAARRHTADEQRTLREVFGEPSRWSRTLKPLHWAEVSRVVPAFERTSEIELVVPCTYDLDIASSKYLHAVRGGTVRLRFLFRGTVFVEGGRGLSVSMLPWDREASFELPAETWRTAMDSFFPEQGWLRLHREILDSLLAFKAERALPSWDAVMRDLLGERMLVGRERTEAAS